MTASLGGIEAITFDFGNTLVPVGRAALRRVVELTADAVARASPGTDRDQFLRAWSEERDRQFRENVPQFREVDIAERLVRIFARLRGMPPPEPGEGWDQAAAAELSDGAEIERAIEAYSTTFVDAMPPVPGVDAMLARLARSGRRLAILSNWPLAATVDRYAEARGWCPSLRAIVISQRVGVIKPHPAIYAAARSALGEPNPASILHVGDDWAADVAGAAAVGWRTALVTERPSDTPLPTSERDPAGEVDLVIERVTALEAHLGWVGPATATATR
ncbi:MAG TPA: HAD family hydrolase [Candidatus Limnocylindrales bacterium]|nr:HAD family hydrolase [Candidatus Limnocylindrales bacterium]